MLAKFGAELQRASPRDRLAARRLAADVRLLVAHFGAVQANYLGRELPLEAALLDAADRVLPEAVHAQPQRSPLLVRTVDAK